MRIASAVRDSLIALTGAVAIAYISMDIPTVGENTATAASGLAERPANNAMGSISPQGFATTSGLSDAEELSLSSSASLIAAIAHGNEAPSRMKASHSIQSERLIDSSQQQSDIASLDPIALHAFQPERRVEMETDAPMMPNIPSAPAELVVPPPAPRSGVFSAPNLTLAANRLTQRQTIVGVFGEADNAVPHQLASDAPATAVLGPFGSESVIDVHSTNDLSSRAAISKQAEKSKVGGVPFGNGGIGGNGFKGIQSPSKSALVLPVVLSEMQARYTTEAERARIQGEVTLQVRFLASGQVEVIRIVNGLGHGLDEEARHVAEQIRFRPALRNGEPVDHTTLVHVTFQLA